MKDLKQVLCIKWGNLYNEGYVNRLYSMVARNISSPFTLTCLTDNSNGIRKEVICLKLPELDFKIPPDAPGKWPKQILWKNNLLGLNGVFLFLDLDNVIVNSIDEYFKIGSEDDVFVAKNWVKPWTKGAQTSVFRFKIGSHPYMYDDLRLDPSLCIKYQFEQNYVTHHLKGGVKFWPYSWTKHFRRHCMGPWPLRYIRAPIIPNYSRIITFPGSPKPPDAIDGKWNSKSKFRSRYDHIKWSFSQSSLKEKTKQLRRFILPTLWVKNIWKDDYL